MQLPQFVIKKGGYVLCAREPEKFISTFPDRADLCIPISLGIRRSGERLELYDAQGAQIDSIYFAGLTTDSAFTLSLLLPQLDGARKENWQIEAGGGSPGRANTYYLQSIVAMNQRKWSFIGLAAGIGILALWFAYIRNKEQRLKTLRMRRTMDISPKVTEIHR
jgi:hypothetical protein